MTEEKKETQKPEEKAEKTEEKKEAKPAQKKAVNYVYGALLLHSAGKDINEANMQKVIDAAGVSADKAQIKALVANLEGVDIDEAVKAAVVAPVAASAPASGSEEKKEEKKAEEEEKKAEEAAAGLGSLFG